MVSKNQIKLIISLQQKKIRNSEKLFVVEGEKGIQEFLKSELSLEHLYITEPIFNDVPLLKKSLISEAILKKISSLTSPNNCLALFHIPEEKPIQTSGLIIALDTIRDPGNLGTIIRLCDWFGVSQIVCSSETVDAFNPKVVQATMGSITRVKINYIDLPAFISKTTLPVYGTFMDSASIYSTNLPKNAVLIMGNEANGISSKIESLITERITIPRFGESQQTESLNVATATAIILSEFRRR